MLGKLLKYDLKKNMRWLWILFVCAIASAGISRGFSELGKNIGFFRVLGILFDSIFYALVVNSLLQPFLRGFMNFAKSLYGDESYLTHTLPVTKNQIINSKYITTIIEILLGFACVVLSILIRYASPAFIPTIKMILMGIIGEEFSAILSLTLFILLVLVEFLMFISIIYFSIVMGYKYNEKKVLKSFLFTALMSMLSSSVLSFVMIIVMLIMGVNLTSAEIVLTGPTFLAIILSGIIVYAIMATVFYFLAKQQFNKGVNVD